MKHYVDNRHWAVSFLSTARLDRYLTRNLGNIDSALAEYADDLLAIGELLILINLAEVCIRNALVEAMQTRYGTNEQLWHEFIVEKLTPSGKKALEIAKSRILSEHRRLTPATVTSGLSMGFWVSLLSKTYEPTLWTQAFKNVFQGEKGLNRARVHAQINSLLRLRNLAAHHGLIFRDDMPSHRALILTIIQWISPQGHDWAVEKLVRSETNGRT